MSRPLDASVSLDELPRFVEALGVPQDKDRRVAVRLTPRSRGTGQIAIDGTLKTTVRVTCQRCLGAMTVALDVRADWLVAVTDEAGAEQGAVLLPDTRRVDLLRWVEDELLLSLPQYPAHKEENCGDEIVARYMGEDKPLSSETTTPFADLKALLSEKKSS